MALVEYNSLPLDVEQTSTLAFGTFLGSASATSELRREHLVRRQDHIAFFDL